MRQTEEDAARTRAKVVTTRRGETPEMEREERLAREEMAQMLRDETAVRADARAELQ